MEIIMGIKEKWTMIFRESVQISAKSGESKCREGFMKEVTIEAGLEQ